MKASCHAHGRLVAVIHDSSPSVLHQPADDLAIGKTVSSQVNLIDVQSMAPDPRLVGPASALAFPSSPQWLTPAGIELVGPRYFGYDVDYTPFAA